MSGSAVALPTQAAQPLAAAGAFTQNSSHPDIQTHGNQLETDTNRVAADILAEGTSGGAVA